MNGLLTLLVNGRPPAQGLERVVRLDPGLVVRVLATANSAAFSRGAEISDLRRAIVRLGVRETCRMALALCMTRNRVQLGCFGYAPWTQALVRASLAESLARQLCPEKSGTLFCAGLLADVGKTALDPTLSSVDFALEGRLMLDAELAVTGHDHCELAGALLTRWGLPSGISDLVTYMHAPAQSRDPGGARVLELADALARGFRPEGIDALAYPEVALPDGLAMDAMDVAVLAAMTFSQKLDEVK